MPGLAIRDPWPGGTPSSPTPARSLARVLIVDDEPGIRVSCRCALELEGIRCDEAGNGMVALQKVQASRPDLLILDVDMPGIKGTDLCRDLRATFSSMDLKIILMSGRATPDDLARMLSAGADDVINKPFSVIQLQARVKLALHHQADELRSERLNQNLSSLNHELEDNLALRERDLERARNTLVLTLTKLAECRDNETGGHLRRLAHFSVCLAEEAAVSRSFGGQIDGRYIEMLGSCAPLHDIGKVGLSDHILLKPGQLTPDERVIMQTHTVIGYETLKVAAEQHCFARSFLGMAMDIARHHHERHDGCGYPDRLAGTDIPLAARLVALCDVYDALRSPRVYKPALPHDAVVTIMSERSAGQFDPDLVPLFLRCAPRFEQIYSDASVWG
jgi:putative two-component system response regulator